MLTPSLPQIAGPSLSAPPQVMRPTSYFPLTWVLGLSTPSQLLAPGPCTERGCLQGSSAPPQHLLCGSAASCPCPQVSVLTGIIKISLKTLLECVRLRTFGRFGLQQVQVDCHFLQLYLWRFVADEELVHLLLDEVVASAALRCPDPVPMEPSVVEVICERG